MTYDFTPIMDAARVSEQSQNTVIRLLVQALEQMERRVRQLEDRDYQTSGDDFSEQVLSVLRIRSGSAREALEVLGNDCEFDSRVLSVIEDNSYTTFTHIEAEIESKLEDMTQTYDFAAAVEEAVKGSIVSVVEEIIEERINPDLLESDAEDIVRKGLRSII